MIKTTEQNFVFSLNLMSSDNKLKLRKISLQTLLKEYSFLKKTLRKIFNLKVCS